MPRPPGTRLRPRPPRRRPRRRRPRRDDRGRGRRRGAEAEVRRRARGSGGGARRGRGERGAGSRSRERRARRGGGRRGARRRRRRAPGRRGRRGRAGVTAAAPRGDPVRWSDRGARAGQVDRARRARAAGRGDAVHRRGRPRALHGRTPCATPSSSAGAPTSRPAVRSTALSVARHAFADPGERAWLEGLLWPLVAQRVASWREEVAARTPPPPAAVVETPLLFEAGMDGVYDATIAIVADEGLRDARAQARGHHAVDERAARQLSQAEKAARATYVDPQRRHRSAAGVRAGRHP